jgi:hypothetical protein
MDARLARMEMATDARRAATSLARAGRPFEGTGITHARADGVVRR